MQEILFENLGTDVAVNSEGDWAVDSAGDLAHTMDGRTCLLQDVNAVLDTLPGDLFAHPTYGAGVPLLAGAEDEPGFEALAKRAITDALTFSEGVGARIEPESIEIVSQSVYTREAIFHISFRPIAEEYTNRLNLVWSSNLDESDLQE